MHRRKKDAGEAKQADAGIKDDKKTPKKQVKKGKRGRETSASTSVPVQNPSFLWSLGVILYDAGKLGARLAIILHLPSARLIAPVNGLTMYEVLPWMPCMIQ